MKIVQEIGALLKKRGWRLALAESCTGGALADAITNASGSSEYFEGGVVAYSNTFKIGLLGVNKNTLKKFGAVSESVAREMACGVLRRGGVLKQGGAEVALAVTGIAGPGGGTKEKPVGTVFIALAMAGAGGTAAKKTEVKHFCFPGSRLEFKRRVVEEALRWLKQELL